MNYNVTPDEIKAHFCFLFVNKDDPNDSKRYRRNTAKTIKTIKMMKKTQKDLKNYLGLKKPNLRSPHKKLLSEHNIAKKSHT